MMDGGELQEQCKQAAIALQVSHRRAIISLGHSDIDTVIRV